MVQFLSRVFLVNEWDLSCTITVIRIGGLKGTCSIGWQTQDSSAVSGLKYMGGRPAWASEPLAPRGSGVITFGPGEAVRTFARLVFSLFRMFLGCFWSFQDRNHR